MTCRSVGRLTMAVAIVTMTSHGCGTAPPGSATPLVAPILNVETARYVGGLTPEHRQIAEQVRAAMLPRYLEQCPAPDPDAGQLIGFSDDEPRRTLPSLWRVDPDLASLIRALDNPRQEVRDLAAYTIGLLGPSAKEAQPFLRAKWADRSAKGGWYGFALEKVACEGSFAADFRRTIPDDILPPREPFGSFVEGSARLIADLYLDERLDFPPGMMGEAYRFYGLAPAAIRAGVVPSLARILEDDRLSRQKHVEAVQALIMVGPMDAGPALPVLVARRDTNDRELRDLVVDALLNAGSEEALPGLVERINGDVWRNWRSDTCWYGAAAISAEDRLIDVALRGTFAFARYDAVDTLACIGSRKAVPALARMLEPPDWQVNEKAAVALREIGVSNPVVIAALTKLYETHWSVRVKKSAWQTLAAFGVPLPEPKMFYAPEPPTVEQQRVTDGEVPETFFISNGGPQHFDHGLPWCDYRARYSIDGMTWFPVKWIEPVLQRVPRGFRGRDYVQSVGTHSFLRVSDGWLFGSQGFEGQGFFLHVSDSGTATRLIEPGASIVSIFEFGGKYFAIGSEPRAGDPGALIEITRSADGKWSGKSLLTLPGSAWAHAVAPTGELLLGDGPNGIAIVGGTIVPMKCEVAFPNSFFAKN